MQRCAVYYILSTTPYSLSNTPYILYTTSYNHWERPEVRTQTAVMVPDIRLELPASTPGLNLLPQENVSRLAELKFTCSKTHYKPGVRQHHFKRTVARRAEEIVKEYQKKADDMDQLLGEGEGEEEGRGRIRRRLDQFGYLITVLVGKNNELSDGDISSWTP